MRIDRSLPLVTLLLACNAEPSTNGGADSYLMAIWTLARSLTPPQTRPRSPI